MKKILSLILCAALLLSCCPIIPLQASAADEESHIIYQIHSGEAVITDCDDSISGDITIPSTLEGYPVTAIRSSAFGDCINLTGVTIPDSIITIGDYAFYGCTNLTSVTIGDGVTSIGERAFLNCHNLTSVTIGNNVTSIGGQAFSYCDSLSSVTIPESVTSIGVNVFYDCELTSIWVDANNPAYSSDNKGFLFNKDKTALIQAPHKISGAYTIPDSVTTIGDNAFCCCRSLTSVTIPDSVTTIGDDAFRYCSRLTGIWVDVNNTAFSSDDSGVLFNKDKTILIQTPERISGAYTIPDSVTTIGDNAFLYCDGLQSITIPDSVTNIGDSAFSGCTNLTSITIPDSVTTIGNYAFRGCTSLSYNVYESGKYLGNGYNPYVALIDTTSDSINTCDIYLDTKVICSNAFSDCANLTSVAIPDSVTNIGSSAFSGCTSLTSVTIPDSVTNIGYSAFSGCTSLTLATIGNSVTNIGDGAFYGCTSLTSVTIPDSVTNIGSSAFSGCTSLTLATIGNSVVAIGDYAFAYCDNLTSVTIPDSVTSIGEYAFNMCNSLTAVHIKDIAAWCAIDFDNSSSNPLCYAKNLYLNGEQLTNLIISDSVTSIGDYAFYNCGNLTSATIPDSVASIGDWAFYNCGNLTSATIPDSVTSIGDWTFYGCSNLTSATIGNSVTNIGDYAFTYCDNLTSVTIPDSVTSIGEYAFSNCTSLTSVTVPDSVTNIGSSAFSGCSNLTSATIGNSVASIGNWTFYGCESLTSVTIGNSVTTIGDSAFRDCRKLTDVYYAGTGTQWNQISIDSSNYYLTHATIHYNHIHDYSLLPPVKVEPTCTEVGYSEYTCAYGEKHREEYVPALGHQQGDVLKTVQPTCEEQGYSQILCDRCGETYTANWTAALGHDYTGPKKTIEPTCTENGAIGYDCTRCGAFREDEIISALGHKMVKVEAEEPTCTETGLTVGTACERCQMVGVAQTTVPATGHNYVDGVCTGCGLEDGKIVDAAGNTYVSLSSALESVAASSKLTLQADVDEDVTVNKTVSIDLNGFSVTGTLTVEDGNILYGMDMQTDDYTIRDGKGYGKISKVVLKGNGKLMGLPAESDLAEDGYMMITEEDGVSFHRVNLQMKSMSLRAADSGIYFKSDFAGDELVAENVKQFGVALSVQGVPAAENMDTHCKYSKFIGFQAGKNADTTSTLLKGVMKSGNAALVNHRNANMPIYGRAYILTNEGEYIFGAAASRTFKQQVEAIDTMWSKLSATQRSSLADMYTEFARVMGSWNIPNLKEYMK